MMRCSGTTSTSIIVEFVSALVAFEARRLEGPAADAK